ncbi:hypothetical protein [Alloactinosynnema sp. L-07]|nr:hypothetical protein [Alloactinosynnema sp. L-07]
MVYARAHTRAYGVTLPCSSESTRASSLLVSTGVSPPESARGKRQLRRVGQHTVALVGTVSVRYRLTEQA